MHLKQLTSDHVGRRVIYVNGPVREDGVITSWNEKYIFVRFDGGNGIACLPAHLRLVAEPKEGDE